LDDSGKKQGFHVEKGTKILRLSRTIADLQGDRDIGINHLTEAISLSSGNSMALGALFRDH